MDSFKGVGDVENNSGKRTGFGHVWFMPILPLVQKRRKQENTRFLTVYAM